MTEEQKKEVTSTSTAPDYKAELEKMRVDLANKTKELDQAKFTLTKKNIEAKEGKNTKVFGTDEDDTPVVTTEDVVKLAVSEALNKSKAEDYLSKNSTNADEIELAKFHLENTIKPSGNPEFDAQSALSIANRGSLIKKNQEMKTAMINKNQMMNTNGGSGQSSVQTEQAADFSRNLTNEQLTNLRTVHKMNDKQIAMFIEKRNGTKHTFTP